MWSSLSDFLLEAGSEIAQTVTKRCQPLANHDDLHPTELGDLLRSPLPAQSVVIQGMARYLAKEKDGFLFGDMGTGKTSMALAILHMLKKLKPSSRNWIVVCPPHLTTTWIEEAWKVLPQGAFRTIAVGRIARGEKKDRTSEVLWDKKTARLIRIPGTDFQFSDLKSPTFRKKMTEDQRLSLWVLSRETMKLGFGWKCAQQKRRAGNQYVAVEISPGTWRLGAEGIFTFKTENGMIKASGELFYRDPVEDKWVFADETTHFAHPKDWINATRYRPFSLGDLGKLRERIRKNADEFYPARHLCPVSNAWLELTDRAKSQGFVYGVPVGSVTSWDPNLGKWVSTTPPNPDALQRKFVANWQADERGVRRESVAGFITRYLGGFFDGLVLDEAHEHNNIESAQGLASLGLAQAVERCLVLTGTATNGTSTSLWTPFFRISPTDMARHGFGIGADGAREGGIRRFAETYGVIERIIQVERIDNRQSRATRTISKRLLPGIVPAIHSLNLGGKLFVERAAFITLDMVSSALPKRKYETILVNPEPELLERAERIQEDFRRFCKTHREEYGLKPLVNLPMVLTNQFDVPDREISATFGDFPISAQLALDGDHLYPKEQAYIEFLKAEAAAGRQVLTYIHYVNKGVPERLSTILNRVGIEHRTLLSGQVPAADRKRWFDQLGSVPTVLVNPACIQTGLTLLDFPTIAVYQAGTNVITQTQAEARPYRIGARHDVRIAYFGYAKTVQALTLDIMKKRRAALQAFQGIFTSESFDIGDGGNSMVEIGKMLLEGQALAATGETWRQLSNIATQGKARKSTSKPQPVPKSRNVPTKQPNLFDL